MTFQIEEIDINNEQDYLEMANHFKEVLEKKENIIQSLENEILQHKKTIITTYGVFRLLDEYFEVAGNIPFDVVGMVELLRGYLSEYTEKHIL